MTLGEAIFVDASAWFALADKNDANHRKAAGVYPSLLTTYSRLVTSNLVIAEAYVLMLNELGHMPAFGFLERIKTSPRIARVYSTEDIESEAQTILGKYHDHDFSYVDAVSFAIMKRQKIRKAFAFDKHFHTAGFIVSS
jgi:predicted nucleic acid-binding protein